MLEKKLEKDGQAKSWAAWTKEPHTLLPFTDLIIFGAPEEKDFRTIIVPWECVREVAGRFMLTAEINPHRLCARQRRWSAGRTGLSGIK